MLGTEEFLGNFEPADEVTNRPIYLNDFTLAQPDYNDGGPGDRIFFVGDPVQAATTTEAIDTFLDVMEFASNADGRILDEGLNNASGLMDNPKKCVCSAIKTKRPRRVFA
jgi:hypothetical protein